MLRSAPANVPSLAQHPFLLSPDSDHSLNKRRHRCTSWLSRSGAAAASAGGLEAALLLLPSSEPTSVLDIRSPSPSSTLSSSVADGGFGSVDESSGAVAVSAAFCDGASDGQSLSDDGSAPPWDSDDREFAAVAAGWRAHHSSRATIGQYGGAAAAAALNMQAAAAAPVASINGDQTASIQGCIKQHKEGFFAPPPRGGGGGSSGRCLANHPPEKIVKDETNVADGSLEDCVMAYRKKRDREDYLCSVDNVSAKAVAAAPEWFHSDWGDLPPAASDEKASEFGWLASGGGDGRAQLDLYEAMQVLYRSGGGGCGGSPSAAVISQPPPSGPPSAFANSTPAQQRLPSAPSAPPLSRRLHPGNGPSAAGLIDAAAYASPAPHFHDLSFPTLPSQPTSAYKFRSAPQFSVSNPASYAAVEAAAWAASAPSPPVVFGGGECAMKRRQPPPPSERLVGRSVQVEELLLAEQQLSLAAEAAAHGEIATAQAILARLNQLSSSLPKGLQQQKSPTQRAIFHFKEALARRMSPPPPPPPPPPPLPPPPSSSSSSSAAAFGTFRPSPSAFDIIAKISAYKSFCHASPIPQFTHFMANQAILDATEGEASVHVIDFELGLGGQWASLMQEMAQRGCSDGGGAAAELIITTVVGEEALETRLARENLLQFGKEVGLRVQVEAMGVAKLEAAMGKWAAMAAPPPALVVNFGIGLSRVAAHFTSTEALLSFLRWLRALSPKVIAVSDIEPLVFSEGSQLREALQFYACVFESLDAAVAMGNLSAAEMAEIEAQIMAARVGEALEAAAAAAPPAAWAALLQKAGFAARRWSAAAEGQAACLAASATPGFSVRKQQEALQLAWYNRALVCASAWA